MSEHLSSGLTTALNAENKTKACDGANHGVTSGIVCALVFCGVVAESMQQIAARPFRSGDFGWALPRSLVVLLVKSANICLSCSGKNREMRGPDRGLPSRSRAFEDRGALPGIPPLCAVLQCPTDSGGSEVRLKYGGGGGR
jgi:hypothetical protein